MTRLPYPCSGLVPIVPGVNLPVDQIPIFMVVLIVCAVIHEVR